MFCLMDVSGSMGEREKDLAKRFYMLLHLFLKRRYERVDVVFIRHTHHAEEVDEETFFYSRQSGGTVVSTALEKMLEDPARALFGGRLEHLCGASVRRVHPVGRCAALRRDARRRRDADLASTTPISKSSTSANLKSFRTRTAAPSFGAPIATFAPRWKTFAQTRIAKPSGHLPCLQRAVRQERAGGGVSALLFSRQRVVVRSPEGDLQRDRRHRAQ